MVLGCESGFFTIIHNYNGQKIFIKTFTLTSGKTRVEVRGR